MRGRDTDGPTSPNWYLHPLVAEQKRHVHLELARRWTDGLAVSAALKTDLFEEAFGDDAFYLALERTDAIAPEGSRKAKGVISRCRE